MSDFDAGAGEAADTGRQQRGRSARRSPARVAIPRVVAGAVLIAAVLVALPLVGGRNGTPVGKGGTAYAAGGLKPLATCDAVLQYFKDQAADYLIERASGGGGPDAGGAVARDRLFGFGR